VGKNKVFSFIPCGQDLNLSEVVGLELEGQGKGRYFRYRVDPGVMRKTTEVGSEITLKLECSYFLTKAYHVF
jgi:hypothetical protein